MWRRVMLAGMASGVLVSQFGCRNCCKRRSPIDDAGLPPPPGGYSGGGPGGFLGPPSTPLLDGDRIPPPSLPTTPGGGDQLPPPPVIPDNRSTFRVDPTHPPALSDRPAPAPAVVPLPPAALPTRPAPNQSQRPPKELLLPDAGPSRTAPPKYLEEPVRPPEQIKPSEPPPASVGTDLPPPSDSANRSLPPPPSVSERAPAGLSGYTAVAGKTGVYAGRKPALDGFDALKTAGFRTIVYLHDADADVGPARELAGKRGLTFVPVPVSPDNLARAVSAFNAAVTNPDGRPIYVCDEDGVRAGVLWYIHFRTVDLLNDDVARVRAAALGYTEDGPEAQRFAAAAHDYLATR